MSGEAASILQNLESRSLRRVGEVLQLLHQNHCPQNVGGETQHFSRISLHTTIDGHTMLNEFLDDFYHVFYIGYVIIRNLVFAGCVNIFRVVL